IDDAAFGAIYGSITAMGVLAASDANASNPLALAGTLFTAILAVALAKAYAELAASALETGQSATLAHIAASWRHSHTVLIAANAPTLAMLLSAAGVYDIHVGLQLAKGTAILLLIFYGARVAFRVSRRLVPTILGGGFTGAIGIGLSQLKNLLH
ncbi:MAG: hypothetical protein AAF270_03675, partial [Pseudomonadota bacterium]